MQLRVGNKQDEPECRELSRLFAEECGLNFSPESADSDLRNIETNYLGHDGVFLVVEEDEIVVAYAAARGESDAVCVLRRLCVAKEFRRRGIGRKLFDQVVFFARNLDYHELKVDLAAETSAHTQASVAEMFLASVGLAASGNGGQATVYVKNLRE